MLRWPLQKNVHAVEEHVFFKIDQTEQGKGAQKVENMQQLQCTALHRYNKQTSLMGDVLGFDSLSISKKKSVRWPAGNKQYGNTAKQYNNICFWKCQVDKQATAANTNTKIISKHLRQNR